MWGKCNDGQHNMRWTNKHGEESMCDFLSVSQYTLDRQTAGCYHSPSFSKRRKIGKQAGR